MDQAGKSFGLMKQVSSLESQLSDLMAKIVHFEECDSESHRRESSGFQANCGSQEGIVEYQHLLG
jgi:hypothetical protein